MKTFPEPASLQKASGLWRGGWYRHARVMPSENSGPRPAGLQVDLIVVHSISLPPGEFGNGNVQRLFTNQLDWEAHPWFDAIRGMQVSAHFFVARTGALWQFVSCADRAWHAGQSAYRGRSQCNDDSIGIELEGLEGQTFEQSQYETLASLCSALCQAYPIEHIAGHEHIAPGRKSDPGAGFDWKMLKNSLALPNRCFPESA